VKASEKTFVIEMTMDYSLFTKHEANRRFNERKHSKLVRSMKKHGFLPYWPVVVYKNGGKPPYPIEDGQHRVNIAEGLKLPIYYVECDREFDIAEINNTQKVWQTIDYAETHAAKGIQAYIDVLEFDLQHKIGITNAASLLGGVTSYAHMRTAFESGTFKTKDREWADKVVNIYRPIKGMCSVLTQPFLLACMAVCRVPEFEPARMIHSADRCRDKLVPYGHRDGYLTMMEDVYNHGRSKTKLIPLKFMAQNAMEERGVVASNFKKRPPSST
jgi:hypothetical protein